MSEAGQMAIQPQPLAPKPQTLTLKKILNSNPRLLLFFLFITLMPSVQ